jgi:hypothetical protein
MSREPELQASEWEFSLGLRVHNSVVYTLPTLITGGNVSKVVGVAVVLVFAAGIINAQSAAPNNSQVVMYSATLPNGAMASVTYYNGQPCTLGSSCSNALLTNSKNYAASPAIANLSSALSTSIGTALSIIPIASPSSAVITSLDAATGAQLPASVTLGPIFAERAETIGRHRFYVGFTNQDFHFTSFNGQSLKPLTMLDPGGQPTTLQNPGANQISAPATYNISLDARLSQNVTFLTYGLTSRFDASVGLPVVHSAISSQVYNGIIYNGNGFAESGNPRCWCTGTLTPGSAPGSPTNPNANGLLFPSINSASHSATGFGDLLLRFKGTVVEQANFALAVGTDLRLATGDAKNFLGTGTTSVRPFLAASFYTKSLGDGIVLAPHVNVGWQYSGQSTLAGQLVPTAKTATVPIAGSSNTFEGYGTPFTETKDYLPDVFSWVVGTELALGPRNTIDVDFLGNEIGLYHGIPNMTTQSVSPAYAPQANALPVTPTTASGFVSSGRVSYGQYSGAFGYKARVYGNLVTTLNFLVRFDRNGLRDGVVPLFGLAYTF